LLATSIVTLFGYSDMLAKRLAPDSWSMIDSTCIKVYESSNGRGKTEDKAVGRTKGGLNTKLHAIVDGLGNPVASLLSPGNDNDATHVIELMSMTDIAGSNLQCAVGSCVVTGTSTTTISPEVKTTRAQLVLIL